MSWKKWPYWLRGGVIGGGIGLVFAALTTSCLSLVSLPPNTEPMRITLCIPIAIPSIPPTYLMYLVLGAWLNNGGVSFETSALFIASFVLYFIVGSLIGALVIHNKRRLRCEI